MRALRDIPAWRWWLVIASAVLQVLIFPLPAWGFLAWVAIAPLLWALLKPGRMEVESASARSCWPGFWMGYLSGVIFYAGSCSWIYSTTRHYGDLAPPLAAGAMLAFGLYLGLYHGLFGALLMHAMHRRGARFALAASPFVWVALELARERITGVPWELLGYAQVENIALTRMATVTAVYGLSFVILAVNAVFAAAWLRQRPAVKLLVTAACLAAGLQALQLYRPAASPTDHHALLVQHNIPIVENQQWNVDYFDKTVAGLVEQSRWPADDATNPKLIVWPESPAPFFFNDPRLGTGLRQVTMPQHAFLILGSLGIRDEPAAGMKTYSMFNSATLISPEGNFLARYDKIHLVPFGEYVPFPRLLFFVEKLTREIGDFTPGESRSVFVLEPASSASQPPMDMSHMDMPMVENMQHGAEHQSQAQQTHSPGTLRIGTFICYESIFPDEIRQFVSHGAQVLVTISNDGWYGQSGAPVEHLNVARMRAIETHRWILRSTNTGITASIDPYGRVVARAPRDAVTTLFAPYGIFDDTTFYVRHGDWFAYACAIIAFILLFFRLSIRGRMGTVPTP